MDKYVTFATEKRRLVIFKVIHTEHKKREQILTLQSKNGAELTVDAKNVTEYIPKEFDKHGWPL